MAGLNLDLDPVLMNPVRCTAGTHFARRQAGVISTRPETYSMVAKIAFAAAAILVVTPAAVTVFMPERAPPAPVRSVDLSDPILGFSQTGDRIEVRLRPAANEVGRNDHRKVVVRNAQGIEKDIPLAPGQTIASAELPPALAGAGSLTIRVE